MSSTYSAASEGSALGWSERGCEPSRSVRSTLSVERSWPKDFQDGQSTTMSDGSRPAACEQMALPLMSSQGGFHARTCREPDTVVGSLARGRDFGPNLPGLLASFDPITRSWKTS